AIRQTAACSPRDQRGGRQPAGRRRQRRDCLGRPARRRAEYQGGNVDLYATAFYAETAETNVEIAPLRLTDNTYEAFGLELEGSYSVGPFSLSAGATWTDAEIKESLNAAVIGNTPRRQADLVFQGTAQYENDVFTVGLNAIGTTDSYTQDNNQLKLPGYTQVNAFVAVRPMD
ncbi:TonB-dependent receptor domain-containing protein, partial [Erythrobacter sp. HI0028]|uniref:TonB-dependent receptor domain-containing protein n=1 Tax=Erythrobacter sp. HI0028 TaxID=1822227 RepID=UPI000A722A0D